MLHFVDSNSRMHHVYSLLNKNQDSILGTFKQYVRHVERRWGFKIKIIYGNGETAAKFGSGFQAWVAEEGITMETSPPHTQDQNGLAERSGGVIITRSWNMKQTANLPDKLWPEIVHCAGYLLNRSPTKSLGWQTLIGYIEKYLGNRLPKPSMNHLVLYGCRAYSYIKKRGKLEKLEPRAYIGYLVGYDSTNIFCI